MTGAHDHPRRLWWIVAGFLAVQVSIVWLAANGPFVDEALYAVAGMRVLEGRGLSDGYMSWFNGSPFVWPVIAAFGHRLGGLSGARLMAVLLSTVALVAFAQTAETLFGRSVAEWCTLAFAVNGLFMALAHFAVYDVAALAGVGTSMWCVTRPSGRTALTWPIAAAVASAGAIIAKYGSILMLAPLLGVLVSAHGLRASGRVLAPFLSLLGFILAAYFWLCFGSLFPVSSAAYLEQRFDRTLGHIAGLHVVFALAPLLLAAAGALVAWRRGQRLLVVTCLMALSLFPAFHLWSANFVSSQKHAVFGFLFAYLLAGVPLERLWAAGWRFTLVLVMGLLMSWGALQCYWQDRSWADTRALAHHLALNMRRGDLVVAESSWNYILRLYPGGVIRSPAEVIDANYAPGRDRLDLCQVPWLVGNPDSAETIRTAIARCGHAPLLSTTTYQYYVDTARMRLGVHAVIVRLYRLPRA